ncbi:hypothetical protein A3L04_01005 [Thermococcus chitonophagus]|uniref:CRISPR system Cms protein Csm2 n=1 Tax=Thermococcus chitonophagus TaxID=54262 RepID=A0A160VQG3_9EURY|nr:type III-A CRISPR-associated protein Csm2 [Thermococcus chitonophagus]ASJ15748.1 hypothetical protein A3L04_01005 [Thermococcus chitonophagus]CUX76972.1 CRISPR-associated protein, Csm2 family [Thermococcus chitonophagus]
MDPFVVKNQLKMDKNYWSKVEPKVKEIARKAENFQDWEPGETLDYAITIASYLVSKDLRTNQIRKILEMVRNVELKVKTGRDEDIRDDVARIRLLLAYTVGKSQKNTREALEHLYMVLEPILKKMSEDNNFAVNNFGKFFDFLQAIVAYHRFLGGKEK